MTFLQFLRFYVSFAVQSAVVLVLWPLAVRTSADKSRFEKPKSSANPRVDPSRDAIVVPGAQNQAICSLSDAVWSLSLATKSVQILGYYKIEIL